MAIAQRWASQAAQDALLRYNPQRSALAQQIREAGEKYGGTVRAARTTAQETQRAAERALPLLHAAYGAADSATQPGATLVSGQLAQPGVDPSLRAGAANEVQQQIANLAKARSSGESTLLDRGVRAREGAQFAQLNAQDNLSHTLEQLFGRGREISQEQGAFAQSEAEKLAHEAEDLEQRETASKRTAQSSREGNAQQERASERQARTSRENTQEKAAHERQGKEELSGDQQVKASSHIDNVANYARSLFEHGLSRSQVIERLSKAQPSISTKEGSADIHIPGRPAIAPDVLMSAALDKASTGGYVSNTTAARLKNAGYSLSKLGLRQAPHAYSQGATGAAQFAAQLGKALTKGH